MQKDIQNTGMYEANIHALLLILAINKLLLGVLVLFLKKRLPNLKGLNYWAYGSILTAIGLFIYSITPYPTPPLISFAYSAGMLIFFYTGDVLFLTGFLVFFHKPVRKFLYLVPVICILIAFVFTLVYHSIWLRMSLTSLMGFMLYFYTAMTVRKLSDNPRILELLRWTSYLYYFYAFIQLVRFYFGVTVKTNDPTGENIFSVFLIAAAGITLILLTFSFIVIIVTKVNEKLEEEIKNKNRLHAIIAHDLRNSFNSIVNSITLLKMNIGQHKVTDLDLSVQNLSSASISSRFLMENLFNWSQSQLKEIEANPVNCNISQLIHSVSNVMKPLAEEKQISVSMNTGDKIYARCDEQMLEIVIVNILSNAIKFSNINGHVEISVAENSDAIEISISDNGIGLSEKLINQIMQGEIRQSEPGTQKEKGYGFGLILCKRFIQQNNGILKVVSEKGEGSTFMIFLPKST